MNETRLACIECSKREVRCRGGDQAINKPCYQCDRRKIKCEWLKPIKREVIHKSIPHNFYHLKGIEELKLVECRITQELGGWMLDNRDTLEVLSLDRCTFGEDSKGLFFEALEIGGLRKLDFNFSKDELDMRDIVRLGSILERDTCCLEKLLFSVPRSNLNAFLDAFGRNTSLYTLGLRFCSDLEFTSVLRKVGKYTNVKELVLIDNDFRNIKFCGNWTNLPSIGIRDLSLMDVSLKNILRSLHLFKCLYHLRIRVHNNADVQDVKNILYEIQNNTTLKNFAIENIDKDMDMPDIFKFNQTLKTFKAINVKVRGVFESMLENYSITDLDIRKSDNIDKNIIFKLLVINDTIERVTLDYGVLLMGLRYNTSITKLTFIAYNKYGIEELFEMLTVNKTLQYLKLVFPFGHTVTINAKIMVEALKTNNTLKTIECANPSDTFISLLLEVIPHNEALSEIILCAEDKEGYYTIKVNEEINNALSSNDRREDHSYSATREGIKVRNPFHEQVKIRQKNKRYHEYRYKYKLPQEFYEDFVARDMEALAYAAYVNKKEKQKILATQLTDLPQDTNRVTYNHENEYRHEYEKARLHQTIVSLTTIAEINNF